MWPINRLTMTLEHLLLALPINILTMTLEYLRGVASQQPGSLGRPRPWSISSQCDPSTDWVPILANVPRIDTSICRCQAPVPVLLVLVFGNGKEKHISTVSEEVVLRYRVGRKISHQTSTRQIQPFSKDVTSQH